MPDADVTVVNNKSGIKRAVESRPRFDVAVTDLMWANYEQEYCFDGLDVLGVFRTVGKQIAVVFTVDGRELERDYLDEALEQPEVAGICARSMRPESLIRAIDIAATGGELDKPEFLRGCNGAEVPRIHRYFATRRGETAARLAGAIASGRAVNHETLAKTALVGENTAKKVVDYLGPLIRSRGEHDRSLKMTPEVIYRWCGEHEPYILSWCRRNGLGEIGRPRLVRWGSLAGSVTSASDSVSSPRA
jgi:DNA-binding NarL/FixJ family response regulator